MRSRGAMSARKAQGVRGAVERGATLNKITYLRMPWRAVESRGGTEDDGVARRFSAFLNDWGWGRIMLSSMSLVQAFANR